MKIMKTIKYAFVKIIVLTTILSLPTACSKDNDQAVPVPAPGTILKDIYACGNIGYRAVFWKNGLETYLTDGVRSARAYEIIVNGSDVYVVGKEDNAAEVSIPKIWKNGVLTTLTSEIAAGGIIDFDIEGANTYVVGKTIATTGRDAIAIWKNGVKTIMTDGTKNAVSFDVDVVGSDVYILGYESASATVNVYKIWKNGIVMTILTDGSSDEYARKLKVLGNNVFVVGATAGRSGAIFRSFPTVWKNGTRNIISENPSSYVEDVAINGNDIYVAGYEFNASVAIAKIWKNGVATSLTSGTTTSKSFSIAGLGNDIYVSGFEGQGSSNEIGKIWKNGTVLSSFVNPTFDISVNSIFLTTN